MKYLFYAFIMLLSLGTSAQNVGVGTTTPNPSAQLDVSSTRGGLLSPRMDYAQIKAIPNPAAGLMVWCTNCGTNGNQLLFDGTEWTALSNSTQSLATIHNCGADSVHNPALTYGTMTDQDGNLYNTIQIGSQTWMAENLKAGRFRNGNPIPLENNPSTWASLTTAANCWYNNDSAAYDCPYGRLYNWYAVVDSRNLCPTGWHVPTDAEFSTLTAFLVNPTFAGGLMKSSGIAYWFPVNTGAGNNSGFSGLPGGSRASNGSFSGKGLNGNWWSSSQNNTSSAWLRNLSNSSAAVFRINANKMIGYSVRCIKD